MDPRSGGAYLPVTGHMKLNTYLVGLSGYPTVVVDLVSEAILVMADARASE